MAPFDGIVIKRMKNPGESVRANEAVVELGNLTGWAPTPMSRSSTPIGSRRGRSSRSSRDSPGRGEPLPIEKKRFRGKITFVDPQIQPVAETAVPDPRRVREPAASCGRASMVQMTIFLTPDVAAAGPDGRPRRPGRARAQ